MNDAQKKRIADIMKNGPIKQWQIIRMSHGKQQHYNRETGEFENSADRWAGQFEATTKEARALIAGFSGIARKTNVCSFPKLHEVF